MDTLTRENLENLMKTSGGPLVSIFLPTHRAGSEIQQDPIRLKNLVSEAREKLAERGLRVADMDSILAPADELLENETFWRYGSDGLALFLAEDEHHSYRLPVSFEELLVVTDRYHVKPLLPLLAGDGRFYVLALSQNEVRLLRGSRRSVSEVELSDVPKSLSEALRFDDSEKQLQFHTGTRGGSGGRAAVFHGHGANEDSKDDILRYFQQIDRGITEILRGETSPLVLAGVDYLHPIYRRANSYTGLLEEGITGNPENLDPEDLHEQAWEIVSPLFQRKRREAAERYAERMGTGQTASGVREVVPAARFGRVDTLFVASGRRRWGSSDPETGEVDLHDELKVGGGDLLDLAAVQTLLHGGTVYVVEPEEVPEDSEAAALLRY
ncbi:hypothetical protein [Rubrobacter indicoceani]|uniref:baeRF7 domain-containing protein n=1 Tax=Rubrobacter indicoceani TaxID=2051957 RepID=UPI000E5A13EF|nr:hypothetical protein [Rubrobacter indicoceani]